MLMNISGRYDLLIGDILVDPISGPIEILSINDNTINIKYLDEFEYEDTVLFENITHNMLHNPYNKNIFGVACIGVVNSGYITSNEFFIWKDMIVKCYNKSSKQYKNYGGVGVTVCNKWLCFENFNNDLPKLPGYYNWKNDFNNYYLNKDIKSNRLGRLYSDRTCCFTKNNTIFKEICKISN